MLPSGPASVIVLINADRSSATEVIAIAMRRSASSVEERPIASSEKRSVASAIRAPSRRAHRRPDAARDASRVLEQRAVEAGDHPRELVRHPDGTAASAVCPTTMRRACSCASELERGITSASLRRGSEERARAAAASPIGATSGGGFVAPPPVRRRPRRAASEAAASVARARATPSATSSGTVPEREHVLHLERML